MVSQLRVQVILPHATMACSRGRILLEHVDMNMLHTDKIELGFPVCGVSLSVGEVLQYIDKYMSKLL